MPNEMMDGTVFKQVEETEKKKLIYQGNNNGKYAIPGVKLDGCWQLAGHCEIHLDTASTIWLPTDH